MKILITAFDAFGGEELNPSAQCLKLLPDQLGQAQILKQELPTIFGQAVGLVTEKIRQVKPDRVLHLGQAGGRSALSLERVAINLADAKHPDNAGQVPVDQAIQVHGSAAYFSNLPIKAMLEAILQAGIPAEISNTAGTFVCNQVMYQSLYLVDQEFPQMQAGFIHLPYSLAQILDKPGQPALGISDMVRGLEAGLDLLVSRG
ncbi:pyroglutamyl-peptidase I [Suicoccus acidiformans]|uniref:Pyroglutamyl-peptidase I n=1 Tax=Suicoccus acidiformans TaxID=2036206 RepID=A0A347WNW0_9LACT|nr:pyroglutamyl-peptidase I [Suicoccus acidiformans]AXY26767.1 pyroglutamyl-peptidase I [Suicoccus acidiformans]